MEVHEGDSDDEKLRVSSCVNDASVRLGDGDRVCFVGEIFSDKLVVADDDEEDVLL